MSSTLAALREVLRHITPGDLERTVYTSGFLPWWETYGKIIDINGDVVTPRANALQRHLSEIREFCDRENLPFRVVILKPRQEGISTWSTGNIYFRCSSRRVRGVVIGGSKFQSSNLLKMVKEYSDRDDYFSTHSPSSIMVEEGRWENGSTVEPLTAANPTAARSATFQELVATEVAYWGEEGARDARKVLSGALSCIHDQAGTGVVLESTGNGTSGDFYERYWAAQTFEQFKISRTGFVRVFMPWFLASEKRVKQFTAEMAAGVRDSVTVEELEYMKEIETEWGYRLSWEELEWRRRKLEEKYNGDESLFEQDYPRSDTSAFLSSGRRKFSEQGLRQIEANNLLLGTGEVGNLVDHEMVNGVMGARFVEAAVRDSLYRMYERPKHKAKYILSVDPAKGQSQTSGGNPDSHGAMVIRDGYFQEGRWYPPMDVCRIALLGKHGEENLLTITNLADAVARMARFYGNCTIVVEENVESGLIHQLSELGCRLMARPVFNRITQKSVDQLGWRTTEATKKVLIEGLASRIFDPMAPGAGIQIRCPWTVREIRGMVTKPSGAVEAEGNRHDDQCISLGIGLSCLDRATVYLDHEELARRTPQYGFRSRGKKSRFT